MQFALRAAEACDHSFLYGVFERTHGQQLAAVPLAPAQRDALLRMQFNARASGYRQQYPQCQEFIISVDGESRGGLWLNESAAEVLILDIAILPEYQGRGIGSVVIRRLLENAASVSATVRLQVDRMNFRAAALYHRLGFRTVAANEVFEEMETSATAGET